MKNLLSFLLPKRHKEKTGRTSNMTATQEIVDTFDERNYLLANSDVETAIHKGQFTSGLEHFLIFGMSEVKEGKRILYLGLEYFVEEKYLTSFSDVREAIANSAVDSAFDHYIKYGAKEILREDRKIPGHDQLAFLSAGICLEAAEKIIKQFDHDAYLKANSDVVKTIDGGKIESGFRHFIKYGIEDIRLGRRKLYSRLPIISANEYGDYYADVINNYGGSPFEHFLLYGAKEMLEGARWHYKMTAPYVYSDDLLPAEENEFSQNVCAPLLSVVIFFDLSCDKNWLQESIASVEYQKYSSIDLIVVINEDELDNKIYNYLISFCKERCIKFFEFSFSTRRKISKELLLAIKGEYIFHLKSGDKLTRNSINDLVNATNCCKYEFIYGDEDKVGDEDDFAVPHFKPEFSPHYIESSGYIGNAIMVGKEFFARTGGYQYLTYEDLQYALSLRLLENNGIQKIHVSRITLHCKNTSSKNTTYKSRKSILEASLKKRKISAKVSSDDNGRFLRVKREILNNPLVSIIIPFRDEAKLLTSCIKSIVNKSTYENFEIIGVNNQSVEASTFKAMNNLSVYDKRVVFYDFDKKFNYSEINNYAVVNWSRGRHILFLNNDIEIISAGWIEALLEYSQLKEVGAVGGKLYYPNNTIQHAGIVLGVFYNLASAFIGYRNDNPGYMSRLIVPSNYSAVTAACMMVKRSVFDAVSGFDEDDFAIAYNDVDFCLRLRDEGLFNVFTPYCEAYHFESVTRGFDVNIEKRERLGKELYALKEKHLKYFVNSDPFYSKNFDLLSPYARFEYSPKYRPNGGKFLPKKFSQKIIYRENISSKGNNNIAIFSHFDKQSLIDPYVIFYLEMLSSIADIIFVSTAEMLTRNEVGKLKKFCRKIIVKENYGYDFGAWKTGLDEIKEELESYDNLILCNDSVYGPFTPLDTFLRKMESDKCDVYSMTDSYDLLKHNQSFFIAYNKKALKNKIFRNFWDNFKIIENKLALIVSNEVKFSQDLEGAGLKLGSFVSSKEITNLNISHYYWRQLIEKKCFPFIKIELLRDNPVNVNIKGWNDVISKVSDYDTDLIEKHLCRVKSLDKKK